MTDAERALEAIARAARDLVPQLTERLARHGLGEIEVASGDLRLLAVSTADTVEVAGEDAPTLADAGYDIDFSNWRGLVAAPGLSDEDVDAVTEFVDELHGTEEWKAALEENGWTDFYKTGDDATSFFDSESQRVADLYDELGL